MCSLQGMSPGGAQTLGLAGYGCGAIDRWPLSLPHYDPRSFGTPGVYPGLPQYVHTMPVQCAGYPLQHNMTPITSHCATAAMADPFSLINMTSPGCLPIRGLHPGHPADIRGGAISNEITAHGPEHSSGLRNDSTLIKVTEVSSLERLGTEPISDNVVSGGALDMSVSTRLVDEVKSKSTEEGFPSPTLQLKVEEDDAYRRLLAERHRTLAL